MGKYSEYCQAVQLCSWERKTERTAADRGLGFSNCFCLSFLPSLPTRPNQALIRPTPTLIIHDVTSTSLFCFVFLDFFFSSILLVPPPLLVKYQQVLERRRRRRGRRRRGDSRGSCVPRPSRLSVHLTLSPHLLQFWLPPGLFVHLYLCFFPLLFLCPPSFSGGEAEEWSVRLWCRWPLPWLFHSTWAQAITKALLADCYYSVMLLSGAGGRRRGGGGGGGGEAGPSGVIGKVIK